MAWARTALQKAQEELVKLRAGPVAEGNLEPLTVQLSQCKITVNLQENRITDLQRLLRSNEVNLFKMQVEKGEVSAKLTKSFEDLESIKAVSIRTIKTQVENSERKWSDVVTNKTKAISKLTKDLQESKAAANSENKTNEEKIKSLTLRVTNQQNQISIQNQQINNQQQQINSLIMGNQDIDMDTPSASPDRKNQPDPQKNVKNTPSQPIQRIPITKTPQGLRKGEVGGSSSGSDDLEVVFNGKGQTPPQPAAAQPNQASAAHKLEVKKVNTVPQQAALTVLRTGPGGAAVNPAPRHPTPGKPMRLQVTQVNPASTAAAATAAT